MANNILNVCLVAPLPPPYGGISHWTSMVSKYSEGGSDAVISVINTSPTWRSIHDMGLMSRIVGGGFQLIRDLTKIVTALRASHFDVIHLTTSGHLAAVRDLVVSYVASLFHIAMVYHIRFGRIPSLARADGVEWRLLKMVMERATTVIAIDQATLTAIKEFAPAVNVCLIPNCVNTAGLPLPQSASDGVKTAMFLGWVIPTKGVRELVEAWGQAKPVGWRLDIVGPVEEDYKQLLLGSASSDVTINFCGQLSHKNSMEHMSKCDLFILPSYTEGFPNVIVEAMALGRPIVATSVGAIPEMLAGDAGILIDSKNTKALADAIVRATSNSDLRKKIGEKGKLKAMENYTIDVVFKAYVALWRRDSAVVSNRK